MGMTPEQRRLGNIAAMYGFKNIHEDTHPAEDFQPGDGVIILTMKGEPIMSGKVTEVRPTELGMGGGALRVQDQWYYSDSHKFRVL